MEENKQRPTVFKEAHTFWPCVVRKVDKSSSDPPLVSSPHI